MTIGRVYKIICTVSNDVYVGSTFNTTRDRFRMHKNDFNNWLKDNKRREVSIYPYFQKYGIESFKMILIKEYDVVDRTHLFAYEQLYINKLKPVSKVNTIRIQYLSNKNYYENNKQNRIRPDDYKEKFNCECGGKYMRCSKSIHFKTKKTPSFY